MVEWKKTSVQSKMDRQKECQQKGSTVMYENLFWREAASRQLCVKVVG